MRNRRAGAPRAAGGRRRADLAVLATIAVGGALGATARYGLAQTLSSGRSGFPWATFWTNVTGSLALGVVVTVVLERLPPTRYLRPLVATGFLGAYTTYSTFAVESVLLADRGHQLTALAYTAASLVGGLAAAWAGVALARVVQLPHGGRYEARRTAEAPDHLHR